MHDRILIDGFCDLDTTRPEPMAAISWTAVNEYCKTYDIAGELREEFETVVTALDRWLLEYRRKQNPNGNA